MSYSVFDPETRELALAGAAFPRPWLVRNGIARQLPVEGLPLGILPDTTYQDYELQLQENGLVVLCSDGFHESMNSVGEEFGVERIQRLLSRLSSSAAGDVVSALLSAVDDHSAGN
jgi:sigma-B regulation protein RsbU (phosphoserine phosphatase)